MYKAIYKCRLCGEIFSDGEIEERIAESAIQSLRFSDTTDRSYKQNFDIRSIHECQDGSFGLADFQGFKKVEG